MKKTTIAALTLGLVVQANVAVAQVGIMPIPQIDTAELETSVEIAKAAGGEPTQYIYRYTVTNPATSSDEYYKFSLDISAEVTDFSFPRPNLFFPTLQTLPKEGGASTRLFVEEAELFKPFINGYEGQGIVPIGLECPPGWNGGLRRNATVVCYAMNGTPGIAPGDSLAGFAVHSRFPPMLREVDNTAFWTVVVDDLDADSDTVDPAAAFQVLTDLRRPQTVIGPGFHFPTDRAHYILLARDLADMKALGWIPNATLAEDITTIIEDAGELYRTGQGIAAKLRLDDVITVLDNSTAAEILPNAATFLSVNVDSIQEFGRNSFPSGGLDTDVRFSPGAVSLRVGETYEVDAFAFRLNSVDFRSGIVEEPNLNAIVYFGCDNSAPVEPGVNPCPNVPLAGNPSPTNRTPVPVDSNGIAQFSYVGTKPGRDHIDICLDSSCEGVLGGAIVDWTDPPDLVVEAFSPPIIFAESGELITFTDRTANIGTGSSGSSFTAYYISPTPDFDITTATFIDSREVSALQPGEVDEQLVEEFELPAGFDMGEHFLFACADDDEEVDEADEFNNCSDAQIEGSAFFAVPVAEFDDLFAVSIADGSTDEGNVGTTDLVLSVDLNRLNPSTAISFGYQTVDGTATVADNDYIGTSGTITFPAGSGSPASQQISITIVGDTVVEGDETITLLITPVLGNAAYRSIFVAITIDNDDDVTPIPNIRIDGGSIVEGDEGTQALGFVVSIDQADPNNDVTVQASTVDSSAVAGDDYESQIVTVTFPSGSIELTQEIFVNVLGDFVVEDDETFEIQLASASSNSVILVDTAVGTIEDDDLVSVIVGDVSEYEGDSGVSAFNFNVSIDQADPSATVLVDIQTIGGSAQAATDYNAVNLQLSFAADTSTLSQVVTVEVIGDEDVEPDEDFRLVIISVSANAVAMDGEGVGQILNDDSPRILDCSTATASPNALWPPNHKSVSIDIASVFALDGSDASIVVTGIEQDEPVNGLGDGDTSPDGFGVGTDSPQVRRERSGLGDGRLYFISFDASDATNSATCSGQVAVGVPHDQGQGSTPIDSGVRFDSTLP